MDQQRLRPLASRFGPYLALAIIITFMFWVRMRPADRVITDSAVFFSGNDAWYHKRMVELAIRHFPSATEFDPWTYFPYGTGHHSGFGGLFDQLVALASLLIGLGSPSDHLADVVLAVAPPVLGALTAIPTYLIAKRITGRWAAVLGAALLSLFGGGILARSIVGFSDHHIAEALFSAAAIAGVVYAVDTAYRESPTFEDILDRNWTYVSQPTFAGIVGGIAVAAYLATWPYGVMLLSTIGVFVVIQIAREHAAGRPTDHLAFATIVLMLTTGVMMLIYARSSSVSAGDFSLLQPLVAFGIAGGTAFLFGLSRYAERTGYERRYYPPFVGGLAVFALVLGRVMYPPSVDMLRQLITRVYSFGLLTSPTARTVREIHPASISDAISAFGLVFPVAIIGLLLLGYHVVREDRPVELLVVLWSLTMLSAYFTMVRFGYYLAVNIAVLATYAIWWIVTRGLALDVNLDNLRDVELHHVAVVVIVLVLIVPGNVIAMGIRPPVWEQAEGLGGTDRAWYDGLTWMKGNTPDVPMGYYEQYDRPADEDYDYPEGAYGVMSWWDYGHWITVMGHRIPYANPFQQGPRPASAFFQATNETRASLILEALPSIAGSESAAEMSVQALRDEVSAQSDQEASENGRYVVIDDQMAGGKFPAITQWAGPDRRTYFTQGRYQIRGQNVTLPETSERYGRTMLAKLYYDDASGLSHYRLVHEVDRYAIVGGYIRGQQVRTLTSLPLQGDWNGIASIASRIQQSTQEGGVVSLGQGSGQFVYNANVESRVKLYERVEGATLTGAVPDAQNGTPVYAILRLQTHTGRNFTYVQRTTTASDGTFRMTVPYATDDSVTPANGGTNSSVEALGAYSVRVGRISDPSAVGAIQVPEGAVYEGRKVQVPVEAIQQENQSTRAGDLSSSTFATDQPTRSVERRTPGLAVDTAS